MAKWLGRAVALADFTWKHSDTAPIPTAATAALLSRHAVSRVVGSKQATGGVLPICVDDTRQPWCLLGENHRAELCHFHGWIEAGETFEMGAAREAFEESKGSLGDVLTLWKAVCDPSFSRRCSSIVVLSLGTLTQAERDSMCADFVARPVLYRGMTEVRRVWWVRMRPLRQLCLHIASGGKGEGGEGHTMHDAAHGTPAHPPPLPPGLRLRPFLLRPGWLGPGGLWEHADVQRLLDCGVTAEGWLRLQDMACMSEGETALLANSLADTAAAAFSRQSLSRAPERAPSDDGRSTRRKCDP
jgi:hypothetical protein